MVVCRDCRLVSDSSQARYRTLFGNAEFSALFAAHVISLLGDVIAAVALTVLVYERTGSPALAALTFSLAFLPYLFAGVLLSALVDRLPARGVLVGCDLLSALIVALDGRRSDARGGAARAALRARSHRAPVHGRARRHTA